MGVKDKTGKQRIIDESTARFEMGGIQGKFLKVVEDNSNILKEILLELKAIKSHQAQITEAEFDGTE